MGDSKIVSGDGSEISDNSERLSDSEKLRDLGKYFLEILESDRRFASIVEPLAWKVVAQNLVRSIYIALLNRIPDSDGSLHYGNRLKDERDLYGVLTDIASSYEFMDTVGDRRIDWMLREGFEVRDTDSALIFLHVQKTAGTSIKNMLLEIFPDERIFKGMDTLHLRSAVDLSRYDIFMGHFNFDSTKYIARDSKKFITFLREPKARLASLYKFWRAHEPQHPSYHDGMELANQLSYAEYLDAETRRCHPDVWNHMTWVILGHKRWSFYKNRYSEVREAAGIELGNLFLEFQAEVERHLATFEVIGLQEKFKESVKMLGAFLGMEDKIQPRRDHSLEQLVGVDDLFKKNMIEHGIDDINFVFNDLIVFDSILYRVGSEIFEHAWVKYSGQRRVD
jgi:hypothetical protein